MALQAVPEGDPWFYFQHKTTDPCIDLTFQANVSVGRIQLLVSNTPELRPTETNWTWTSNSADGMFAYQPHTVQVPRILFILTAAIADHRIRRR